MIDNGQQVAQQHGAGPRSQYWPGVEKKFKEQNPHCAACADTDKGKYGINIHHIHPYHICVLLGRPDLELDPRNLITLCSTEQNEPSNHHHIVLGHLDDFQLNNDNLLEDIKKYKGIEGKQLLQEADFKLKIQNRPKPFPEWTSQEKISYRSMLDILLPPDPIVCYTYKLLVTPYQGQ